MKRVLIRDVLAGLLSAAIRGLAVQSDNSKERWVALLSIRSRSGQVYVYRDTFAGYGEMTFTVDRRNHPRLGRDE